MSHNIFGERFLGIRQPGWHSIGTVLPEPVPAEQGLKLIDGDFQIVKAPLKIEVGTLFGTQLIEWENKFALVREPTADSQTYEIFGHCGPDYEIIQHADFAKALDKLTGRWPLETIGLLGKGEKVFFTLDAGMIDVAGEEVHQYFLVTDCVDGKTAAKIAFTPVRVVCQNTLTTGLSQATMTASLDHRTGMEKDFNFRVDLMDKLAEAQRMTINTFELMAHSRLVEDEIDQVFAAAFPYPSKPKKMGLVEAIDVTDELLGGLRNQGVKAAESYQYYCDRADTMRKGARYCLDLMNDKNGDLANSSWYVYNAVVENSDWRDGADSAPESALWGTRSQEKVRAFKVASAFIK